MNWGKAWTQGLFWLVALVLSACGGGTSAPDADEQELAQIAAVRGGAPRWQPPAGSTPRKGNYVFLQSEAGDYIGQGANYLYTQANAVVSVVATGASLTVSLQGDQQWTGVFQEPARFDRLKRGPFLDVQRHPFQAPEQAGLNWFGEGRGCNAVTGWIVVDEAEYRNGQLTEVDLRFEQRCDGQAGVLRGKVHWEAGDRTQPPGPVNPPPANLWRAGPGTTPASGNYVYLESDFGDYVGQGLSHLYTRRSALISVDSSAGLLVLNVRGDQNWSGQFMAMNSLSTLQPGYYGELRRYPFHNPTRGGLNWDGEGRGCNTLSGWFVIDRITYTDGRPSAFDLRFEQHCEGASPALRGQVHWDVNDTTPAPGPQNPPPANLWQPAADSVPATGSHVYLESEPGDFVGQGARRLFTLNDAVLGLRLNGGGLHVDVQGDQSWSGDFQAMVGADGLQPGYYGDLGRFPFHNPLRGGLSWSGEGRGCNTLSGWFVIDAIEVVGGVLRSVDLRFEQHCEGQPAALHGRIRWNASDTGNPPGPVNPPPPDLWQPDPSGLPASGNYLVLESTPGDFIGAGQRCVYTSITALIQPTATGGLLNLNVQGAQQWSGQFQAMQALAELQPGYYGSLSRYPFNNPLRGGLSWSGEGRGCNTLSGWFVVDQVSYLQGGVSSIDLRFEQRCDGAAGVLHGKLHWSASDTTQAPGPVNPPPADLWRAPAGSTPASGNYVYLESEPGDFIGAGQTILDSAPASLVNLFSGGNTVVMRVTGAHDWGGQVTAMSSLAQLQPGYYSLPTGGNPVAGSMSWSGEGRACGRNTGWFVVDQISHVNGSVTSLDLRFEQHCEGLAPALHGQVHWSATP